MFYKIAKVFQSLPYLNTITYFLECATNMVHGQRIEVGFESNMSLKCRMFWFFGQAKSQGLKNHSNK